MLKQRPRAVVTGAGSGLGRALSQKIGERGGQLLISDVREDGLAETKRLVEAAGGRAEVALCDVSKVSEVEKLRDVAREKLGGVDLMVNNAGVAVGGAVGTIPLSDWEWIMGINLWGVIYGCHTFLPLMKEQGSGHILNVASVAGLVYAPEMGPYNVTKAAVVALSETLYGELRGSEIGVTVLCPYFFRTNIARAARAHTERASPAIIEKLMGKTPIQAAEVAALALSACDKNALFCLPHREAKVLSALKRLSPKFMHDVLAPRAEAMMRR